MSLTPSTTAKLRRTALVAVLTAAMFTLGACASAGAPAPSATGSGSVPDQSTPVAALSVVTPNADPSTVANLFLAKNLGYFVDQNVDVNIINGAGAAGASLLVSGEADMLLSSTTIGFPLAAQGQPISVVFSDVGGGLGAALSVATGSPVKKLQDLSGKKVGTIGTTGATYGFANYLSKLVVTEGGQPFELVAFNDAATMNNSLISGSVDAVSSSTGTIAALVANNQARIIVDTSKLDQRDEYIGSEYTIDTGYIGLKGNLDTKRESVVRFLEALTRANLYLNTHTPEEISKILANDATFSALDTSAISASVIARFPFYTPYNGYISEEAWDDTLAWFSKWDIPTLGDVANNESFSYANIVDMSYLTEAQDRLGPDALAPEGGPAATPTPTPSS
ncbi:ABC transporter substrate-binding protein [Microbacterium rhizomatis]|uniref:ABC transporter substrate-binding protein n=1 Tax=Microbacterium rhizomatis TaxID=1631477 RepID=A0A5J5J094_9MICO|nr:ABC transporter substrate-binding protein [Microbacterium rhizomatis]KAA9107727.1 ABC transporter substrate-binding protein [Microbacterium rhizomatis]